MLVDAKVHWYQERVDNKNQNDGLLFGIYTYDVPDEDINTDDMFNNDIVNVEWFKTEKERDNNIKNLI
jgi:hypothetical protein